MAVETVLTMPLRAGDVSEGKLNDSLASELRF